MNYLTKEEALKAYKETREIYLATGSAESWKAFCEAKINCRRLGVRI